MQDLAQASLNETVRELIDKLSSSVDAVLSLSEADLAEATDVYTTSARDSQVNVMAAEEDEDLFACRAALLRLHHLQLLSKVPSDSPSLYISLHKLLQVGYCCHISRSVIELFTYLHL